MTNAHCEKWAAEEFSGLRLGHKWRDQRWMKMAAQAASHPSGQVSECFGEGPERQAAYKLLEKGHLRPRRLVQAAAQAALGRSRGRYTVVPVDQCTLTVSAGNAAKAFGRVGTKARHAFGAESMHAVALDAAGVPLGVLGQRMWSRTGPSRGRLAKTRWLPLEAKETRYWVEVVQDAYEAWLESGLEAPLWYQLDAGANAREVLQALFALKDAWVTVRCRRDRRVSWPEDGMLSENLAAAEPLGFMKLAVTAGPNRTARTAVLELRGMPVVLRLKHSYTKAVQELSCYVVSTCEVGTCPEGEEPLGWTLLTTRPCTTFAAACEVVRAYALRWRIEEVHRTWKSGCKVESSGLAFGTFQPWAALLLCVAVRTERLKRLARAEPDLPASTEFTPDELKALTLLSRRAKRRPDPGLPITLGEAVLWVAEMGGYTGPTPSRGPPGSRVIQRGLQRLAHYAEAIALMRDAEE